MCFRDVTYNINCHLFSGAVYFMYFSPLHDFVHSKFKLMLQMPALKSDLDLISLNPSTSNKKHLLLSLKAHFYLYELKFDYCGIRASNECMYTFDQNCAWKGWSALLRDRTAFR